MRTYTVFNIDQVEGLDHLRAGQPDTGESLVVDYQPAEAGTGSRQVRYGPPGPLRRGQGVLLSQSGLRADPAKGDLRVPERVLRNRHSTNSYHATEHESRLNWSRKDKDKTYAFGELIAEFGGVFVCRELGVPASDDLTNHIAYLGNWLQAMKNDSRFIIMASRTSQQSRFLHPLFQPERGGSA